MGIKEKTVPMIKEGDQKATIRRRSWEVPIKSYRKERVKKGGGGGATGQPGKIKDGEKET